MKKSIFLIAIIACFCAIFIIGVIIADQFFSVYRATGVSFSDFVSSSVRLNITTKKLAFICAISLVPVPCCIVATAVCLFKQIKGSNASNFVRYTYEEYKQYREKKKAEKQAKKKAKSQEIEKTE